MIARMLDFLSGRAAPAGAGISADELEIAVAAC